MPTLTFVLFFSLVLAIYGLANTYVFVRLRPAHPREGWTRRAAAVGFWVVALSFIAGRIVERVEVCLLSKALVWGGSFWLGALVYLLLSLALIDLVRLIDRFTHFLPDSLRRDPVRTRRILVAVEGVLVAGVVVAGHLNSRRVPVKVIEVEIPKSAERQELDVAFASDIHLGTIIGKRRFAAVAREIQSLDPDLILLAGDVIDEDLKPVLEEDVGATLRQLRAPLGVWGITGNHEYIGGVEAAVAYLREHGVRMLLDEKVRVAGMWLVGRKDRIGDRFTGRERLPLGELLDGVDSRQPILLLDHQPVDLGQAIEAGVDLQLSGHTHHGQLWPFNFITRAVYEVSWGYARRGGTQFYVSSGAGTWGPPMRLGNTPEIVHLKLRFQPAEASP